jgi:hypothetical protein
VQEAVGELAIKEAHAKKWLAAAERTFVQVRDRRLAEASQQVEVAINKMNAKLNQLAADPQATSKQISDSLNDGLEEYTRMPEGPTKWQRLLEFMQSTLQVPCLMVSCAWHSAPASACMLKCEALVCLQLCAIRSYMWSCQKLNCMSASANR